MLVLKVGMPSLLRKYLQILSCLLTVGHHATVELIVRFPAYFDVVSHLFAQSERVALPDFRGFFPEEIVPHIAVDLCVYRRR